MRNHLETITIPMSAARRFAVGAAPLLVAFGVVYAAPLLRERATGILVIECRSR